MFESTKARLEELSRGVPLRAYAEIAREVESQYRADATGHTGYVPPVSVEVSSAGLTVRAPEWSLELAREKGQPEKWLGIVGEGMARAFGRL